MQALVEIKKPCHETLESRKNGETGNYCQSCRITVTDFTGMSPVQISAYLMNNEVHCGTFNRKDISTGSKTDRLIAYLQHRKFKCFAFVVLAITILASCRTRMKGMVTPYQSVRPLNHTTESIDNLK